MKKLLWLSLLLTLPAQAQKAPVYACWVLDIDANANPPASIVIAISKDGNFTNKQGFQYPASGLDGVKALCKAEIAKLQTNDAAPVVTTGVVDLSDPIVTPPPPPDPDLTAFIAKVNLARKLIGIVPADSRVLMQLEADIETAIEAHPDWLDSI